MARFMLPDPMNQSKKIKGIVYTDCQWAKILGHVTQKENDTKESLSRAQNREDQLLLSKAMAQTWDNTFINLRRKRFALREQRKSEAEKLIAKKYDKILEKERELKEEIKSKAREIFFEMRDSTKTLRSAEMLSEALRERAEQREFNRQLRQIEKEEDIKRGKELQEDAERFKQEQLEKSGQGLIAKAERKKNILEELEIQKKERERQEKEKRDMEIRQLKEMEEEIRQIDEAQKREEQKKRRKCIEDIAQSLEEQEKKREAAAEDEKEEDLALQIISEGKIRLAMLREEKEKEMTQAAVEKRAKVTALLSTKQQKDEALEEAIYQKAVLEKDRIFQKEEEKRQQHLRDLRQERINDHQEFLKQEKIKKDKQHELEKWAVLQRLKNEETKEELDKKLAEEKRRRYLEVRQANCGMMEEQKKKKEEEKVLELEALKRTAAIWALNDKEFLEMAEKVKKECTIRGRPIYPLEEAIKDFKLRNGLLKKARGNRLVEKIPIVPGYKEAMAEIEEKGIDHFYK